MCKAVCVLLGVECRLTVTVGVLHIVKPKYGLVCVVVKAIPFVRRRCVTEAGCIAESRAALDCNRTPKNRTIRSVPIRLIVSTPVICSHIDDRTEFARAAFHSGLIRRNIHFGNGVIARQRVFR